MADKDWKCCSLEFDNRELRLSTDGNKLRIRAYDLEPVEVELVECLSKEPKPKATVKAVVHAIPPTEES